MIALREESVGNYSRVLSIRELSPDVLLLARRKFSEYRMRGVMLNSGFDDDNWKISDEKRTTKLMWLDWHNGTVSPWIDCNARDYLTCAKVYIVFNLGEFVPFTLQDIARELLKLQTVDAADAAVSERYPNHIAAFLRLLPGGSCERDWVIEQLSERESKAYQSDGKGAKRVLSDFKSYLRFNDALADFWLSANVEEKLFYFPLYFWWNLTAILPLRVTELLLTPRDCLDEQGSKRFITVRRSKMKRGGRKIVYRISEDYETCKYEITDSLAHELREYLDATRSMDATQLGTLFLVEPHSKYINDRAAYRNHKYYSYQDMCVCLQTFYDKVVAHGGVEINVIKLGDTRHLAMVNLMISGGSPVICRELAGHADIGISSHYYTNFSNLVGCATLERLQKHRGGTDAAVEGKHNYSLSIPDGSHRVTGGFCTSKTFQYRDISECLKAVGKDGQIGECSVCPHYLPDAQGLSFTAGDGSKEKEAVDADSRYLMQTIELVRKGLGYQEDIGAALLRLQHSSARYSINIQERFDNGKT